MTEIVQDGSVVCLRLHKLKLARKPPYGGHIWKKVHLGRRQAGKVSIVVVAMTARRPSVPLSIGIACHTGKQDGPTYGVLAADNRVLHLTSDWATYKMTIEIPEGARQVEFGLLIDLPKCEQASVDIRSIEYLIGNDGH